MRELPQPLADALAGGETTLARAWAVTRQDGVTLGFTDHDHALAFDGITFEAASGVTATAVEQATGLAVDTHSIHGALQSDSISDLDLERGLYDGAEIRVWLVDWTAPEARFLLARGRIGEVRRGENAFEAEVTGLAERLNQPVGRAFLTRCDRRLGDRGCGVDLDAAAFRGSGAVARVLGPAQFEAAGLGAFGSRWFERGHLVWEAGANAGGTARVKAHRAASGIVRVTLWQAPAAPIAGGDAFTIRAGCDKSAETCRAKFDNLMNFGGFPHMPGDDWATRYPNTGEAHDGSSIFG
jgi:uncharacterized phage protein (TIGR02218 family)